MNTTRYHVRVRAALAAIALCACARASLSNAGLTTGFDARVVDGVARLRAATQPYRTLDSAVAAGYPRTVADCLVHEHHGAMGYHHVNRGYVDARLDVEHPEILLYEKRPDGEYR